MVKFIYSEKATNFCEISSVDLSYVVTVKYTLEILKKFVAFSEYMNFTLFEISKLQLFKYALINSTTSSYHLNINCKFYYLL